MERTCEVCGNTYKTPPSSRLRFCSKDCTTKWRITGRAVPCKHCGKDIWIRPSQTVKKFCSYACRDGWRSAHPYNIAGKIMCRAGEKNSMYGKRGELSSGWKGGRRIDGTGRIRVISPDGHSGFCEGPGRTRMILEHRFVMEKVLGRKLKDREVVHHINENPLDNRPENLMLFPSKADHSRYHAATSGVGHRHIRRER